MANRRFRRIAKPSAVPASAAYSHTGIDRVSCAWRDAVGPGYVVGVTEGVARVVSELGSSRYCR